MFFRVLGINVVKTNLPEKPAHFVLCIFPDSYQSMFIKYRGSPTSTVSTSTNSTCTHFEKALPKFNLYDFASKSPTCTNSTNTNCHQSPPLVLSRSLHTFFPRSHPALFALKSPTTTKFNGI